MVLEIAVNLKIGAQETLVITEFGPGVGIVESYQKPHAGPVEFKDVNAPADVVTTPTHSQFRRRVVLEATMMAIRSTSKTHQGYKEIKIYT